MTVLFWAVVPLAVIVGGWLIVSVWRIERRQVYEFQTPAQVGEMGPPAENSAPVANATPVQNWTPERGAALVELALVMPLLVLLIIGGVDITMATQTRGELQHLAQQIAASELHEDEAAALAEAHGATLECFDQGTDSPCFADGLGETTVRRQVVLASVFDGVVLPAFTVRGDGLGVMPSE